MANPSKGGDAKLKGLKLFKELRQPGYRTGFLSYKSRDKVEDKKVKSG
jgi:hypothetical protein